MSKKKIGKAQRRKLSNKRKQQASQRNTGPGWDHKSIRDMMRPRPYAI